MLALGYLGQFLDQDDGPLISHALLSGMESTGRTCSKPSSLRDLAAEFASTLILRQPFFYRLCQFA
jgi:hypothetical protein